MSDTTSAPERAKQEQYDAILDELENASVGGIDDTAIPASVRLLAPDEFEAAGLPREFLTLTPQQRFAAVRAARGEEVSPREIGRVLPDLAPAPAVTSFEAKIERAPLPGDEVDPLADFKAEEAKREEFLENQPSADKLEEERERLRQEAADEADRDRREREAEPTPVVERRGDEPELGGTALAEGSPAEPTAEPTAETPETVTTEEFSQPASTPEAAEAVAEAKSDDEEHPGIG